MKNSETLGMEVAASVETLRKELEHVRALVTELREVGEMERGSDLTDDLYRDLRFKLDRAGLKPHMDFDESTVEGRIAAVAADFFYDLKRFVPWSVRAPHPL